MMGEEDLAPASRRKRAYHRKVRTGCQTCKIRRVRCDEGKPFCQRCTSTGRTCDGYPTDSSSASSASPPTSLALASRPSQVRDTGPMLALSQDPVGDQKLALPRRCSREIRSYRYFLDVAGPSLAGIFDMEFWLAEIPRACHADPAIWHAIVSLGAAHEYCAQNLSASRSSPQNVFVLQQFSLSIRSLMGHPTRQSDSWRALAVSVIFTYVCGVQGLHAQASLHLKSGRKILQELQSHGDHHSTPPSITVPSPQRQLQLPDSPITLAPLKDLIANLELQVAVKDNGGLIWTPELVAENAKYNLWRFYEAPREMAMSSRATRPLTVDDFTHAHQAVESLFNGLVYLRQQLMETSLDAVKSIGEKQVERFIAQEVPYARCYKQVKKAHRLFSEEAAQHQASPAVPHTALLALSLALAATRLLFVQDPEMPNQIKRAENLPRQYENIVHLAERVLEPDHGHGTTYAPSATTGSALLAVAHSGTPQSLRRRAVKLLTQYPRQDGLSSSLESASFANDIMSREQELLRSELSGLGKDSLPDDAEDLEVPPLKRLFNSTIKYVGSRSAILKLRTWEEYLGEQPGEERIIHW